MNSLFLKVFLWFWLAMALVAGASLVVGEALRPDRDQNWRTGKDDLLAVYGRIGVETLERDGPEAARSILEGIEKDGRIRAYVLNERGEEILGRTLPTEMVEVAARARTSGIIQRQSTGEGLLVAMPGIDRAGTRYATIANVSPPGTNGPPGPNLLSLFLRFVVALLIGGALCYWLARYIVSPVVKLRAVTRQVAGGDLSARVSPALGGRRDELVEMGRDFDVMTTKIEALLSAQVRLLRDISHELRSPLARLGVALDLAKRRAGAAAAGDLARIEREAARLNEMIGQLLTLSRSETGASAAGRELVNLAALVREVAEDADFEARSQNRSVSVECIECDGCETTGMLTLLRSAFENVVRNAIRHAPAETAVQISLRCFANDGGYALFKVQDEGSGVPEQALADIFRPFYRVDDSRDRATGGTGLGLAITERAVQLHGGKVTASNVPGGGFVVQIHLPLIPIPPPSRSSNASG